MSEGRNEEKVNNHNPSLNHNYSPVTHLRVNGTTSSSTAPPSYSELVLS